MSEGKSITEVERPGTVESLTADLRALGMEEGMIILVHSSLSSLGWVCGGAVAVVEALRLALGSEGTLMMPAHSSALSDPARWSNPPVPKAWWPEIRETMPAFDPKTTPTRGMGAIAECFRSFPGVQRSDHPQNSFCALGPAAQDLLAVHKLEDCFGDASPLARLEELEGSVLLLGVGHDSNTSLHLGELRALQESGPKIETGAPVMVDGERRWVSFWELDFEGDDFPALGTAYEEAGGLVKHGRVGQAAAMLMEQKPLVEFAFDWLRENRS